MLRTILNRGRSALLHKSTPKRQISMLVNSNFLSEDQRLIQESAYSFAQSELLPFAGEWDEKHHFPQEAMKKAAELGLAGIYIGDEYGGSGLGRLEASLAFEALATGCPSTSAYISIHNMVSWMIYQFGNEEQKKKWLPSLTKFDLFSSYCLTEPNSGSDAAGMQTFAKDMGDHYVLNGSKAFISGGGASDLYAVMCKTGEKEISCIIVEKGTKGLEFGKNEKKLGWCNQPTTMVLFEDCKVPKENLLGQKGHGFKYAMQGLDGGRINIASCSLGGAAFSLDTATEYIKTRKQFGKPIADFQYIQFKLAEYATLLEASRLMVRTAATMYDQQDDKKTLYAAMAKQFATTHCSDIVNFSLQLHGGYGYLKEYPIERILRDLRVHQILEGTTEVMLLVISRQLLKS